MMSILSKYLPSSYSSLLNSLCDSNDQTHFSLRQWFLKRFTSLVCCVSSRLVVVDWCVSQLCWRKGSSQRSSVDGWFVSLFSLHDPWYSVQKLWNVALNHADCSQSRLLTLHCYTSDYWLLAILLQSSIFFLARNVLHWLVSQPNTRNKCARKIVAMHWLSGKKGVTLFISGNNKGIKW